MPLDTTLYITTEDGNVTVVNNVTGYQLGIWPLWMQTYRDLFSGGYADLGGTSTASASKIPATGPSALGPSPSVGVQNLAFTEPDDYAHVPPRPSISYESGYFVFQTADTTIPAIPPIPTARDITVAFTVPNHPDDQCVSTNHGLESGDTVAVYGSPLPTGLVASTLYVVVKLTDSTFMLRPKSGGAPVNITANGSGTVTLLESTKTASLVFPPALPSGVRFFPMFERPRLSSTDPRTS